MATDNPFAIDPAQEDADAQRRKKLSSLTGLQSLSQYANEPDQNLQEQPLYGGEVNRNVASPEAEAPSQLATERVQRAPASENASPLLSPEQRAGNILTGEEGTYGPLTGEQRSVSLKDFFKTPMASQAEAGGASGGGVSQDVGGAGEQAGQAIGYAKQANQAGTGVAKNLAKLFQTAGYGESFRAPAGIFNNAEVLGPFSSEIGSGLESITAPQGIFNGVAPLGPVSSEAGAGLGTAGSSLGGTIGMAGQGVGLGLTLASLINSMASGQMDNSKTGSLPGAAVTSLPALGSLAASLGGLGAGAATGVSGLGLAYLPLMIPAIKSLVGLLGDPNYLPYDSGNMSQYRSRAAADQIPGQLNDYLLKQNDPMSLLALATGAKPLSPNEEVLFSGQGTPEYNDLLVRAANGDPQAIQEFIRNASITSGETGGVHSENAQATDTYRRQLANALGLTPEQVQGLFSEGGGGVYGDRGNMDLNNQVSYDVQNYDYNNFANNPQGLEDWISSIHGYADPSFSGDFGGNSPYYRDPSSSRLTPEQADFFEQYIRNRAQAPSPASLQSLQGYTQYGGSE